MGEIENDIKDLTLELKEVTKANNDAHKRIYERLEAIERENAVIQVQYRQIITTLEELEEIKFDLRTPKEKPAKRYDSIVVTGIVTFVMSKFM